MVCLFKKSIVESFDDEQGHQDEEAFTDKGVAMSNCNLSANLTAYQIGAGHQQA